MSEADFPPRAGLIALIAALEMICESCDIDMDETMISVTVQPAGRIEAQVPLSTLVARGRAALGCALEQGGMQ